MPALEVVLGLRISGEPADVGHADDVTVEIGLKDAGAARIQCPQISKLDTPAMQPGLDLGGLLQVLSMGVHLSQHCSDPVVLHAQLLDPLLIVCACLVRDWHVLEFGFFGEIDVIHGIIARRIITPIHAPVFAVKLPFGLSFGPLGDYISGAGFLFHQLGAKIAILVHLG